MHSTNPFSRQQRITNALLLNASFIDNLELMHSKMGIAIYFFHLARETKNQIYEDYACELIVEIHDEIYIHTPCSFENGLAVIELGINFLVQKEFIDKWKTTKMTSKQFEESPNEKIDRLKVATNQLFRTNRIHFKTTCLWHSSSNYFIRTT